MGGILRTVKLQTSVGAGIRKFQFFFLEINFVI
jgi:hypothetical protein